MTRLALIAASAVLATTGFAAADVQVTPLKFPAKQSEANAPANAVQESAALLLGDTFTGTGATTQVAGGFLRARSAEELRDKLAARRDTRRTNAQDEQTIRRFRERYPNGR